MKKIYTVFILSLLCISVSAQYEDIIDSYKMKGKVATVTTKQGSQSETVTFKDGKLASSDNSEGVYTYNYNKDGLLISIVSEDKQTIFKYNLKKRVSRIEPGGYVWTYHYSSDGKLLQEKVTMRTGLIPNITYIDYKYEANGILKQKFITDSTNYNTTLIEFDKFGNIARSVYASFNSEPDLEWINTYDVNQRLIKSERKQGGVIDLIFTYTYELDEEGNWTTQTWSANNGQVNTVVTREITYE